MAKCFSRRANLILRISSTQLAQVSFRGDHTFCFGQDCSGFRLIIPLSCPVKTKHSHHNYIDLSSLDWDFFRFYAASLTFVVTRPKHPRYKKVRARVISVLYLYIFMPPVPLFLSYIELLMAGTRSYFNME